MKRLFFSPFQLLYSNFSMISMSALIYLGWTQRDNNYLSAETGTGYLLGIAGGSLMIILLLYPLSKRVSLLTRLIPIRYWFGTHMLFGVLGPLMILFHSNFQLGSTNSTIALFSMLLVAGSGLVGRYIYTHIHHGLYGSRITLKELKQETKNNHSELLAMYAMDNTLNERLKKMEEKALRPYSNLMNSLAQVIYLAVNAQQSKREVMQLIKGRNGEVQTDKILPDSKALIQSVNRYTLALRRAAAFTLYERLFSLWHILHLPLFIMMIITAMIHIFAVHIY